MDGTFNMKWPPKLRCAGMRGVQRGCLVLADISGYTRYLAGVELEHSTDVLADLLGVVVKQMEGAFRVAKLEGDAVFAYSSDGRADGEATFAAAEACYAAFADRRDAIARATTCPCKACHRIDGLELKLVVHHGEYAIQTVGRKEELVGSDVVVAHRLLKNSVTRRTGLHGYALFTRTCLDAIGLDPAKIGMAEHSQRFAGVGQVDGFVYDLERHWREACEQRVVYVGADEADLEFSFETSAAPPIGWDYLTSQAKQVLWRADQEVHDNPNGVIGVGSVAHCVHGKTRLVHEVVDWRPFHYYSYRSRVPVLGLFLCTDEISPVGEERWRVSHRVKGLGGVRQRLLGAIASRRMRAQVQHSTDRLEQLLAAAATEASGHPGHRDSARRRAEPQPV